MVGKGSKEDGGFVILLSLGSQSYQEYQVGCNQQRIGCMRGNCICESVVKKVNCSLEVRSTEQKDTVRDFEESRGIAKSWISYSALF